MLILFINRANTIKFTQIHLNNCIHVNYNQFTILALINT